VDDVREVDVATERGQIVVPALAVGTAIAGFGKDGKSRIGELYPRGCGQGPAVQAVEGIDPDIVRGLGRLADAGGKDNPMRRESQFDQGRDDGFSDGEIPAPRAPGRFKFSIIRSCYHGVLLESPKDGGGGKR